MENATLETFELRRVYAVTPDKVWRAWLDADALRVWLGQAEFAGWRAEIDARVGGAFLWVMQGAAGQVYEARGRFRELVQGRRLAFSWKWLPGIEALITVDFHAIEGGTELVFKLEPVADPREPDAWRADFKRLGQLLEEK
jgi:uncharacterized protein YndB with AHSA1/START domain